MKRIALALIPFVLVAGCDKGSSITGGGTAKAVEAPKGTQWTTTVTQTAEGGYRMGNPDASLKLIEYGSRSCPHCARFSKESADGLKALIDSGKLSYEFRDFPIHPQDVAAITLGRCGGTGPYFTILEQMMATQDQMLAKLQAVPQDELARAQSLSPMQQMAFWADKAGYVDFVKARGVPEDKARACLSDPSSIDKITAELKAADDKYQISGTPTFILNGTVVSDADTWEELYKALKAAGA